MEQRDLPSLLYGTAQHRLYQVCKRMNAAIEKWYDSETPDGKELDVVEGIAASAFSLARQIRSEERRK